MLESLGMPNSSLGVPGGRPALTHLGIWSSEGCHASICSGTHQSRGPRRSTYLYLPRDPILVRLTCLDLPGILSPGGCHASACLGVCTLTGDTRLSGCNNIGEDKLQKDSPLRKSTHGNRRKPITYGTVPSLSNNSGAQ